VTVNVAAVNDAPVTTADSVNGTEDTPLSITTASLLANDSDVENQALSITGVANATGGTVSLSGGTIVFTPGQNFNGAASFRYTASDGNGGTSTGNVTVNVAPVNDAPVATAETVNGTEDTAVTIAAATLLANDSDVDGQPLSITAVSGATHGTVSLSGNSIVFTPAANFNGAGTFQYTVSDGNGGTATATATVNVAAVNDAPVAGADAASGTEDTVLTIAAATLLANDTDLEGQALTLTGVGGATHGTVSLSGGNVVFTPTPDYNGAASFQYTVSDGNGGVGTGTVSVSLAAAVDTVAGGSGSDTLAGGMGADTLLAGAGNDILYLDDLSGDTGYGGSGDDLYIVRTGTGVTPVLVETAGEGYDTVVFRGPSYTMPDNIEVLLFADTSDTVSATGSAQDNTIIGNSFANSIDGGGGADAMNGGGGTDTVAGGDGNDLIYGGEGNDSIRGDAGNDVLFGDGGTDTMDGGDGNDLFSVDSVSDVVIAGAGYDEIYSMVDYTMSPGAETLFLLGTAQVGIGNATNNAVIGDDVANYLDAGAGNDFLNGVAGNDILVGGDGFDEIWGGSGNDIFRFTPGSGADFIGDFTQGQDKLQFAGFGIGSLTQGVNFFKGALPAATTAGPAILYSTTSGYLFFDADGSGAQGPVVVALLNGVPNLQTTDFSFL
jgi:Ca2+-binding RTX toxin-like protein